MYFSMNVSISSRYYTIIVWIQMIFWGIFFDPPFLGEMIQFAQYLSNGKAEPPTTPLDPKTMKKSRF